MLHKHHHRTSSFPYIASQSGDLRCWLQQAALKLTPLLLSHVPAGEGKKKKKKGKKKIILFSDRRSQWRQQLLPVEEKKKLI